MDISIRGESLPIHIVYAPPQDSIGIWWWLTSQILCFSLPTISSAISFLMLYFFSYNPYHGLFWYNIIIPATLGARLVDLLLENFIFASTTTIIEHYFLLWLSPALWFSVQPNILAFGLSYFSSKLNDLEIKFLFPLLLYGAFCFLALRLWPLYFPIILQEWQAVLPNQAYCQLYWPMSQPSVSPLHVTLNNHILSSSNMLLLPGSFYESLA